MLITSDSEIARYAEQSGVDRIFLDMESLGKDARQGHLDTHKAVHTFADVTAVRAVLEQAELMVRLNPLHEETQIEVDEAIRVGADRLMLPMFNTKADIRAFQDCLRDRLPVTYLAETPSALNTMPSWLELLSRDDQVHIGLNDLSLGAGLAFLFEPLALGMLEGPADLLRRSDVEFGIGGVARPGQAELPADWVLGEHARLGSSWVILSRAFHGRAQSLGDLQASLDLAFEVAALRGIYRDWIEQSDTSLKLNHMQLKNRVRAIVAGLKGERSV